ncbi:ribosomal protein L7/L12 [Streptomyces sp. NPDC052225]|uniref:ribosomal protein L7/L12 n=1 Tax=Streptomyces sp. NPDC052225 TaxID=3154949 RepID=UPI00341F6143
MFYFLIVLILAVSWLSSSMSLKIRGLERKVDRIDRRLDLVLDHLGITEPEPDGLSEVRALVLQGKEIEAIKVYRRITGAGLKEAKDSVDALKL